MSVLMHDMIYVSRDITHAIPTSANLHDDPGGWPILHYPTLSYAVITTFSYAVIAIG